MSVCLSCVLEQYHTQWTSVPSVNDYMFWDLGIIRLSLPPFGHSHQQARLNLQSPENNAIMLCYFSVAPPKNHNYKLLIHKVLNLGNIKAKINFSINAFLRF